MVQLPQIKKAPPNVEKDMCQREVIAQNKLGINSCDHKKPG